MSRRTVWLVVIVIMVLGGSVASYMGYKWYTNERVATGTYRLQLPDGITMDQVADTERAMMAADDVLSKVIDELALTDHWGFESDAETIAYMRDKLVVRPGNEPDPLKVQYRDRSWKLAQEILISIDNHYRVVKRP